jgi:hypothetical protein
MSGKLFMQRSVFVEAEIFALRESKLFKKTSFAKNRRLRDQGCQMFSFQTKNPNLVKFWRGLYGKCWYILGPFGIFYGYLGYFMTIWYNLSFIWYIFPVLVSRTWKNLATLWETVYITNVLKWMEVKIKNNFFCLAGENETSFFVSSQSCIRSWVTTQRQRCKNLQFHE